MRGIQITVEQPSKKADNVEISSQMNETPHAQELGQSRRRDGWRRQQPSL
jgi:hypothetical protein